jgi:hypothetical protein
MRKSVFVLAVIGAACSSVAFAGEVKQTQTVAPVVKATTMSDSEMDKVTAGASLNVWEVPSGSVFVIIKREGSQLHGNMGAVLNGNGTLNQNHHFTN